MKWLKKGLICNHETFELDWYKKNTMVPVPYLVDEYTLRIFITMCDADNIGRIGYVDVNPKNPSEIISYSKKPLIDIGSDGAFDDNGVVTASVYEEGDLLYMFYSGYQLCTKVPYMIFAGLAVSEDKGKTFKKVSDAPLMKRVQGELCTRCVPFVVKENDVYRMWYTSDVDGGWVTKNQKLMPLYDLKYIESKNLQDWGNTVGNTAVHIDGDDEHGIAKCTLWKEDGLYKVIYSIRSLSKGYRLGYGESKDGKTFIRMDDQIGIDVSSKGWDSEMLAFAERIQVNDKVYLFYCGNHYGMSGMGYAELVKE